MYKNLLSIFLFLSISLASLEASLNHSLEGHHSHNEHTHHFHGDESSKLMFAYQFGYTEIHSKNTHMSDDSGSFIGIHLMKQIESIFLDNDLFLAAGAHTAFTDDKHIGVMIGIMYEINKGTLLSIMPGLMFMKHEVAHSNMVMGMGMGHESIHQANAKWETEEAIHIEIGHPISLFNYALNTSIGWMSSSSHNQYSFGLNLHF